MFVFYFIIILYFLSFSFFFFCVGGRAIRINNDDAAISFWSIQPFDLFILHAFYEFGIGNHHLLCLAIQTGCAWMRSWKMCSLPLSIGISQSDDSRRSHRWVLFKVDFIYFAFNCQHRGRGRGQDEGHDSMQGKEQHGAVRAFPFDLALTDWLA